MWCCFVSPDCDFYIVLSNWYFSFVSLHVWWEVLIGDNILMGNLIYHWFFCEELRPFSELYMRENRFWGSYFCSTGFFSVFWNKSIILISDCMKMIHIGVLYINTTLFLIMGSSWLWSYGSWIYNYLCNQCLSPLKLWVWTPFMASCTWYNIMW